VPTSSGNAVVFATLITVHITALDVLAAVAREGRNVWAGAGSS
jgi:hypothetical protein